MGKLLILLAFLLAGCASFAPLPPSERPLVRVSDRTMSGDTITVAVWPGDRRPYCSLPDASNTITCDFYYSWLQRGSTFSISDGGWRSLTPQSARSNCMAGLYTSGALINEDHVRTCGNLLMYVRFRFLPPEDVAPENK